METTRKLNLSFILIVLLSLMLAGLVVLSVEGGKVLRQSNNPTVGLDEQLLEQKIEEGIVNFIRKQRDAQRRVNRKNVANVRRVSPERDHIYGNPEAKISLIEYSDFECPFCKRFHPTAKGIVKAYKGKVNWVYRHFPLGFHNPGAQKEAEASECANELGGNDAFWQYTDLIYARTKSNGRGFPLDQLAPLAEEIGLDKTKFQRCLNSGKFKERVLADFREGTSIGITGTPGNILLNNLTGAVVLKSGAFPFSEFASVIDK